MSLFRKLATSIHKSGILTPPFHLKHYRALRLGILVSIDLASLSLCYWLAMWLRLDNEFHDGFKNLFFNSLPILLVSSAIVFGWMGMYRQVWRYANFDSALLVGKCTALSIMIFSLALYVHAANPRLPRSVPLILWLVATVVMIVLRFSWRMWSNFELSLKKGSKENCIVYGAGSAGELLARSAAANPRFPYEIRGFVDDDPNKQGKFLHGIEILGTGRDLKAISNSLNVKTIIIAMHQASGKAIRDIVDLSHASNLNPLIMPDMASSLGDEVFKPRAVDIKDLLKRSTKNSEIVGMNSFFASKSILVSGAGGSIGSEICRQIISYKPKRLILLDNSEFNLYQIDLELNELIQKNKLDLSLHSVLGNATDEVLVESLIKTHMPDYILHAAAFKHVPLIESNPIEGILNNLKGTKVLSDLAEKYRVKKFLLISSDKAVRPTNVMGASKRACEMYIQAKAEDASDTAFCAVRFGNVLGSSGSVIPRFMKQIQSGGPITVTHPEVTRYFMLTSEAVNLVLQALVLSRGSEIFVLNMGEPIKIFDMAKHLVKLSGKEPGKDIEIIFTGLRPGEKLFEELILDGSESHTVHGDLFIAKPELIDKDQIQKEIDSLIKESLKRENQSMVIQTLWRLIEWRKTTSSQTQDEDEHNIAQSLSEPIIH